MHSLPEEFLALCRQLGEAQQRCSAAMASQAAQLDALSAEVVRLRAAVILRDTRLAWAQEDLEQVHAAHPGLPRRRSMARHITMLAERISALSRECLRWKLAATATATATATDNSTRANTHVLHAVPWEPAAAMPLQPGIAAAVPLVAAAPCACVQQQVARDGSGGIGSDLDTVATDAALDASLAAADLVICQTGCISHDQYWRVQDHCRRTGKTCILVDQPLAARQVQQLATAKPMVVLHMARTPQPAVGRVTGQTPQIVTENAT